MGHFLPENLGQKGHNSNWLMPKKQAYISMLFSNEFLVFIYKKSEKISSAIYLITNFVKDNEPIKTKIRDASLKLLLTVLSFIDAREEELRVNLLDVLKKTLELSSLFDLSFRAGLVSEMNYSVIRRELDLLTEELSGRIRKKGGVSGTVSREFFAVDGRPSYVSFSKKESPENSEISQTAGKDESFASARLPADSDREDKGHLSGDKGQKRSQEKAPVILSDKKGERTDKIISALKQNKEMTVKELSVFIRNFSEKTIQRDLNFLLSKGIVLRFGDKRWSRYSLKK